MLELERLSAVKATGDGAGMVTLICFVGYDFQRIIDGVNFFRANYPIEAIYLLYDKKKDVYGYASRLNAKALENALSFAGSKPTLVPLNPQSYEDVFATLYKILKEESGKGRKVLIDATSTSKEGIGAAVTCALMFYDVGVYIVPPNERGWHIPTPNTPEFNEWFNKVRNVRGLQPQLIYLPGQRLDQPSEDEERILLALESRGGKAESIKSIIEWCGEDSSSPAVKNKYSRLIRKLLKDGLIQLDFSTKTKRVKLSGFGKVLAKAIKSAKVQKPEAVISVKRQEAPPSDIEATL
ncbi:MAG: hypothetical protein DRJ33_01535 [Candidatus Methanomethylicota archaeon]|uniref:HFX-2341-like N-terminal domain-containing protein n=1 Tax=Thermoproteota archaeon TaxID=2056631 RepID=A0A497F1S2_9CREN|nr:MAG: hypothetical protein DRJ33_01535 [Candidatus Verstraetearchaeota archaeon]